MLRHHRVSAGLSQEALAERARISTAAISALERGTRRAPYRDTVVLLADALSLSGAARSEFETAAERQRRRAPRVTERPAPKNNLPVRYTSFISRADDQAAIARLLESARLVTVTGSGGVGKTRVALEVADEYLASHHVDVWFVDLSPLEHGQSVAAAIASVLGIALPDTPDCAIRLARQLSTESRLLILDNCEHVLDDAARVVEALLQYAPNTRILATSRERLALQAEHVYRLPSLPMPTGPLGSADDAMTYASFRLFMDRAAAAGAPVDMTTVEINSVAEICRRLDGIPLAVELAATHTRTLGAVLLRDRLAEHFSRLSGYRDLPARQQTMLATMTWSYDLLTDPEKGLLRTAAVFRGSFTLDALEAVAGPNASSLLASLVNKSMIAIATNEGQVRYRLLELVRAFGVTKLRETGDADVCARAHATWVATFAEKAGGRFWEISLGAWLAHVASEIDNVRAALEWVVDSGVTDDALLGARIINGLTRYFYHVDKAGIRRWLENISARIDGASQPEIFAKLTYTQLLIRDGREKLAFAERAMPLLEQSLDEGELFHVYLVIAHEQSTVGDDAGAQATIAKAFALAEAPTVTDATLLLRALETRCHNSILAGRIAEARDDLSRIEGIRAPSHFHDSLAPALLYHRATIEFLENDLSGAAVSLAACAAHLEVHGRDAGGALILLSAVRSLSGEVREVLAILPRAIELRRLTQPERAFEAMLPVAATAAALNEPRSAAILLGCVNAGIAARLVSPTVIEAALARSLEASLRSQLPDQELSKLKDLGGELDLDRATDDALHLIAELRAQLADGET